MVDHDPHEHEGDFFRGCMNALPISLLLWLLIFLAARHLAYAYGLV